MAVKQSGTLKLDTSASREDTTGLSSPETEKTQRWQRIWDDNFKPLTDPVKHDKTAVLLLSWAKSDMDVSGEIKQLKTVFKEDYHFEVQHEKLDVDSSKSPQLQVSAVLLNFILKFDGPHTLCIIYYAGHGWGDDKEGNLWLTGDTSQKAQKQPKLNNVAWHSAESIILGTTADILVIFDCCYAGALHKGRSPMNSFEFLGACGQNQITGLPGPKSFTAALIRALRELKDRAGFDSEILRRTIRRAEGFPEEQIPVLFHRYQPSEEHVWIAPSGGPREKQRMHGQAAQYRKDVGTTTEHLHLQFHFNKSQADEDIAKFAESLSTYAKNKGRTFGLRRVTLKRESSSLEQAQDMAQRLALDWYGRTVKKRAASHSDRPIPHVSVILPTPPPERDPKVQSIGNAPKRRRVSPSE